MNVAIIGVGVVGGTLRKYFDNCTDHELLLWDPDQCYTHDLASADACFVCVPVGTHSYRQSYSMLEDALSKCPKGIPTFIRSTVLPGTNDKYGTYSLPEFLTERRAMEEMLRLPVVTGCNKVGLMSELFPDKEIIHMSNVEAEISKFAHNCFGATKVNFFNIIHEICQKENANYNAVLEGVLSTGFINDTHTQVPGPDGLFGFGGRCFPENMGAFYGTYTYDSIGATIKENESFRLKHQEPRDPIKTARFNEFRKPEPEAAN